MSWPAVSICVLPYASLAHNFRNLTLSDTIWWRSDHEIWGKCRERAVVVSLNFIFKCTHQIFIHHRQSATPQIIMHILLSFIKQSHPSLYHWTTHGMFSIQVTKLTNFSRFHVLHIQETDYRPHFICAGILYFLEHYKNSTMHWHRSNACEQCLSLVTESTHSAHNHDRSAAVAILAKELIFWITLVYGNIMLAHSSILTVCDNAGWIKERAWNVKEVFV